MGTPRHEARLRSDARGVGRHPAWHVVPGDPPGTLRWWDGQGFIAAAVWKSDHWEYAIDGQAECLPAPDALPSGVLEVRETGWFSAPSGGRWHQGWELPLPPPPNTDSYLKVGVAAVVVASLVWLAWVLVLIEPATFLGAAVWVIPFGTLAALPLALIALRDPASEGRTVTRSGALGLLMALASLALGFGVVFGALLNSAGQM